MCRGIGLFQNNLLFQKNPKCDSGTVLLISGEHTYFCWFLLAESGFQGTLAEQSCPHCIEQVARKYHVICGRHATMSQTETVSQVFQNLECSSAAFCVSAPSSASSPSGDIELIQVKRHALASGFNRLAAVNSWGSFGGASNTC